jgi:hypothetical protein
MDVTNKTSESTWWDYRLRGGRPRVGTTLAGTPLLRSAAIDAQRLNAAPGHLVYTVGVNDHTHSPGAP